VILPLLDDIIVAVSTGWTPAPLGIVRLSGPDCFGLLRTLGVDQPAPSQPNWTDARLALAGSGILPATLFWFPAPRSYTGQDVVEIHTVGGLPLLRELCAQLIAHGARRALPGEFTARAVRTGRMEAAQAEGVLELMQAAEQRAARQAARAVRDSRRQALADIVERLTQLLARVEAGIDFGDEEDVRFITGPELVTALDEVRSSLARLGAAPQPEARTACPHVALVGPPNAGKSTLFNALLGYERALVSPVLGTTRDVLSAELDFDGVRAALQDCAGLGDSADELELATHLASERAAEQADLVLWIHACDAAWDPREVTAVQRIAPHRRLLVLTKSDLSGARHVPDATGFGDAGIATSATTGRGLAELRIAIRDKLARMPPLAMATPAQGELAIASGAAARAQALAWAGHLESAPELIAIDLELARGTIAGTTRADLAEEVLGRILSQFCIGK
jgi:tRNA modification GTPase